MSLAEVAATVDGVLHEAEGTEVVTGGVEFDSRAVTAGGLFVALPGERVDGHDFAATAAAAGAAGVLAGRPVAAPAVLAPPPGTGAPTANSYALAADADGHGAAVLAALGRLARSVVDRLRVPHPGVPDGLRVVGVTGSSGKTSTKDLIAALLAPLGPTVAPPGSFNNELGHPWTVLRADLTTRHLVLELSARGLGHVAQLCQVAPPSLGVVLNVGSAHLGEFGSRAAIAAAKGELVETLPEDGVAVLNADDEAVVAMRHRTPAPVLLFGTCRAAQVRAADLSLDDRGRASFLLVTPVGETRVRLGVPGRHQVSNVLAAAAVATRLGATVDGVAAVLESYRPASRWRMEVAERADGVTVVNDAYNANPESVAAALHTLAAMTGPGRRGWAVLGPLGELGHREESAHREIGELAGRLGVPRVVAVGQRAWPIQAGAAAAGAAATLVPDVPAALELLRAQLAPGDVVLVKASRAFGLERIALALLEDRPREDVAGRRHPDSARRLLVPGGHPQWIPAGTQDTGGQDTGEQDTGEQDTTTGTGDSRGGGTGERSRG